MKRRRISKMVTLMLAIALVFLLASSALAASLTFTASTVYKAFTTTNSMTKTSSQTWKKWTVTPSSLSHSPNPSSYNYAMARPVGPSGELYATAYKVYANQTTSYTPNTSGLSANTVKIKIINAYYDNNGRDDIKMSINGSATGTV